MNIIEFQAIRAIGDVVSQRELAIINPRPGRRLSDRQYIKSVETLRAVMARLPAVQQDKARCLFETMNVRFDKPDSKEDDTPKGRLNSVEWQIIVDLICMRASELA